MRNFANKFAAKANKIELKKEELSVEGIKQFYMDCQDEESKYEVLVQIYNLLTVGQSIIFTKVNSSTSADTHLYLFMVLFLPHHTNSTAALLIASQNA